MIEVVQACEDCVRLIDMSARAADAQELGIETDPEDLLFTLEVAHDPRRARVALVMLAAFVRTMAPTVRDRLEAQYR